MRPGRKYVLDAHRVYVAPGEAINDEEVKISGGGFLALYRGQLSELMEEILFRKALQFAITKIVGFGSDVAVAIANQWTPLLNARTDKNR